MNLLDYALQGARFRVPQLAGLPVQRQTRLLVLGAGGALGSAILAEALVAGRFSRVQALVSGPLLSTLRGFEALHESALQGPDALNADAAVLVFERARHSNGRDEAYSQPEPQDLLALAQQLLARGLRRLMVVLPHSPALLPHALRHGLATLDEGAVGGCTATHRHNPPDVARTPKRHLPARLFAPEHHPHTDLADAASRALPARVQGHA